MVAGMAAMRPIAVANSAWAMPGATTVSEVFCEAAIAWKLVMMPHTVPNRPTNGPAEPTVARTRSRRSSRSISRVFVTSTPFSRPICGPAQKEETVQQQPPTPKRCHQEANQHRIIDNPMELQKDVENGVHRRV